VAKKKKLSSRDNFHSYYSLLYPERWESLVQGMKMGKSYLGLQPVALEAQAYYLDRASALAALALEVSPGHQVLDMCGAPGGKSLVILRKLFPSWYTDGEYQQVANLETILGIVAENEDCPDNDGRKALEKQGSLTSNEKSATRRQRLKGNILAHSPQDIGLAHIQVTPYDAAKFGLHQPNTYDRVLADVPCSSEAHVLEDPKYLNQWSPARTKHLSIQAGSIGLSGFDALKPGGRMVYSTCSLSPLENQEVAKKILHKRPQASEIRLTDVPDFLEVLDPGYALFPDKAEGLGPMYFFILTKQAP